MVICFTINLLLIIRLSSAFVEKPKQSDAVARKPSRWLVLLIIVAPPLLWAGNFIIGRAIRDWVPPVTLTLARWSIALLCILPFALKHLRHDARYYLSHLPLMILLSVSGVMTFSLCVYFGLHYTSGTNGLLLNSCIPALIMLLGRLFYGQMLQTRQLAGMLVSFVGVLAIIFKGELAGLLALSFSVGDLLLLAAMSSFACYSLWLRKVPVEINRTGLLAVQMLITVIATFPLWIVEHTAAAAAVWNGFTLAAVVFLGIFPSLIAYLFFSRCVEMFGPARAGLIIHLIPVFGVLLSMLFLSESLHLYQVAGITAILAGIGFASVKR